jgi:hypothetical protein
MNPHWEPCLLAALVEDKLTGYLEQASHSLVNDGMLRHFQILVYPDQRPWEWRDSIPAKDARDQAFSVFETLADFDPVGRVQIPPPTSSSSCIVALMMQDLYESADRDINSAYVFPGRSPQRRGKKIYSRRKLFERIQRETAIKKYLRQHPGLIYEKAFEACSKEKFKDGIRLAPKNLRDFFCTEIAAKSDDVNVAMRLMRHTSLATQQSTRGQWKRG